MKIGIRRLMAASIVFCFALVGCRDETAVRTDEEMNALIIGTWVSNDGPLSLYYMEKTYAPDGTSTGFLLNRQTGKRINFTSRWQIKDGHYSGQVIGSSDPALPTGASFSTQIIKMTEKQFITIQDGTGRVTFNRRKGRFALF